MTPAADWEVKILEGVLMISAEPVGAGVLAELLERSQEEVQAICERLAESYESEGRGFVLVNVAGGWRFQSHPDLAEVLERFVLEGRGGRLSPAAFETLAVVAYKQPISKAQVSAVRGVDVDGVLRVLVQKGLVMAVGRDNGPGQAMLYGTTPYFLEKMGLASLEDLAPLDDLVPDAEVVEALEERLRLQ